MVAFIFSLPQLCIKYSKKSYSSGDKKSFKLGFENITKNFLRSLTPSHDLSYTTALVTNSFIKDQGGDCSIDVLLKNGLKIKAIFVFGNHTHKYFNFNKIKNYTAEIPTVTDLNKRPLNIHDLKGIEVVFFDVQDIGICYSHSLSILVHVMEIMGRLGKTVVVLDRPNLLGDAIEGVCCSCDVRTSLNTHMIPFRYGMTIGELAQYCNKYVLKKSAQLYVVPMEQYNRHLYTYYTCTGKLPSDDISSVESRQEYSFLSLLAEVYPLDVGIGTNKAFQCILLPGHIKFSQHQWFKLKKYLLDLGIESTPYKYYNKHTKNIYNGLRLYIKDIGNFSLLRALVGTLEFFKQEGVPLEFSKNFCNVPGMLKIKELIDGTIRRETFEALCTYELEHFFVTASSFFIYKPYPKVIGV
jgi:uncharacterized protein YbbC (DUF1343 family)